MAEVGPLGVSGPGGLADLVAPGEGRAWSITGGGNGLGQQDLGLHKCRITAFIRRLKWACNRPIQWQDGHSWTGCSGGPEVHSICSISTFIAHGKGNSKRSISGPLSGLEGPYGGEPVGVLSRAA